MHAYAVPHGPPDDGWKGQIDRHVHTKARRSQGKDFQDPEITGQMMVWNGQIDRRIHTMTPGESDRSYWSNDGVVGLAGHKQAGKVFAGAQLRETKNN
jgi:hypothetical protein